MKEVFVKKQKNAAILAFATNAWRSLLGSLDKFSADCMNDRSQP